MSFVSIDVNTIVRKWQKFKVVECEKRVIYFFDIMAVARRSLVSATAV